MRPVLLHLDDALAAQSRLGARCAERDGVEVDGRLLGPQLRLWARPDAIAAVRACLAAQLPEGPLLVFTGSGDFHHVSALLIERATAQTGRPLTVIHIDNHPDWVKFANGMHCGSWVARAARLPGVSRHVTLGVCSDDIRQPWRKRADLDLVREQRLALFALGGAGDGGVVRIAGVERPTMSALGEDGFLDHLLATIGTDDIYLTIDKDVLHPDDAATNWDQGRMRLDHLERLIDRLASTHRLVGADVCGDASRPVYGGGRVARLLKAGEAFLDQPRALTLGEAERDLNQRANLALFDRLLAEAA